MTKSTWLAVLLLATTSTGSLMAHHSLASFDITTAVRIKGTIVEVQWINPHSIIFVEEKNPDGVRRWAVEGPSIRQLNRQGVAKDILKPGDTVEVCGYLPKDPVIWQIAQPDPAAVSMSGRLLNGETLVMPDGHERSWGDYGAHKCFPPGFDDQHSRR
jgi:hypothetical protein